jgi:diguanylate cyclase (GGDEF)-like protein
MVVDNDPEVIQILEVNLTHANLEVISARNGTQVLKRASIDRPEIILLDSMLPDLESFEICRRLKESEQTSHIPIIVMGAEDNSEDRTASVINGAEHYIPKPFDPKEVVALVETYFKRIERDKNTNPLTGLPNQIQVNSEISSLLEQNKTFAAIYVDIDNLKAFNKVYGFAQGDRAIQLLGEIIHEAVRLFGNPDDLTGHLGGDNFVVVTTAPKVRMLCRRIIRDFDSRIRTLYKQKDLERDYNEYEGQLGQMEQYSIVTLSIAVVTNEGATFHHYLQVSEAAAQLTEHLKRFSGSNYYFDRRENDVEAELGLANKGIPQAYREERKTLQRVLAWVSFLTTELETPIVEIKECLDSLRAIRVQDLAPRHRSSLKSIKENVKQLLHVIEELDDLTIGEWIKDEVVLEEVELKSTFDWIMEQVQELAEQQGIEIDIEGTEGIGRLIVDGKSLTQGLFYLLRGEIKSGARGDQLQLRVSDTMNAFVAIELINRNRHIPQGELAVLSQDQFEGMPNNRKRIDLHLVKVLIQGLGGKLAIKSNKGEGTTFTVSVPKRWRSSIEEVNALLSAAESSRKEARAQLHSIRYLLLSTIEQIPSDMEESLENLGYKIQELMVLCNRSLFLADELSSRLENQQDRLLQHEVEQLAILEAFVVVNREIARSLQVGYLFDLVSARRVAKNALAMANEFRLTRSECQAMHHAALLKDLALVLSPEDMVEQMMVPNIEEAVDIREHFEVVWKAFSRLDFLSPVLALLSHRHERYDGMGHPFGIEGSNIPLGARILAIVDTFDSLTSGLSLRETVEPEMAVQKLVADSGRRFDSEVVSVFLRTWRRREFQVAPNKSREKMSNHEKH